MDEQRYEQLPSTSELKLRVFGLDVAHIFANALFAFFDVQEIQVSEATTCRPVTLKGIDLEHLLIELLSEALYLSHKYKEAYLQIRIKSLSNTELIADLFGSPIVSVAGEEIKAVTHHGVHIHSVND